MSCKKTKFPDMVDFAGFLNFQLCGGPGRVSKIKSCLKKNVFKTHACEEKGLKQVKEPEIMVLYCFHGRWVAGIGTERCQRPPSAPSNCPAPRGVAWPIGLGRG